MTNKSDANEIHDMNNVKKILKGLSPQDFLNFGVRDVAYIRDVDVEGESAFAVYAADGRLISIAENHDSAVAIARHNELETVILQ